MPLTLPLKMTGRTDPERESYELRLATTEVTVSDREMPYRKLQLLRQADYAEEVFDLNNPLQRAMCEIFVEAVSEADPNSTIIDVEGLRHVFVSPDTKNLLVTVRAKIQERIKT